MTLSNSCNYCLSGSTDVCMNVFNAALTHWRISLRMLQILTNACKSLTIKRLHNAWVENCITPCQYFSLTLFCQPPLRQLLENSRRMLANPYKCLTITTYALPSIRMAYDNVVKTMRNFRNLILIFATPHEWPWMLTTPTNVWWSPCDHCNWWRMAFVSPFARIFTTVR